MESFFIVNPVAGKVKDSWKDVEKFLIENEIEYNYAFTKRRGHGIKLALEAARNGYKRIFAVGGDGTVNEVANGILMSKKPVQFGVVPLGTGNDFAKSLGIKGFEDVITNTKTRTIDVGLLKSGKKKRYFVNISGMGFDSYVTENIIFKGIGGTVPYLLSVLFSLTKYDFKKVVIKHDKGEFEQESFMISIANGNYLGGGMYISPFSKMDDGNLDVVIIPKMSKLEILYNLPKIYSGKHIEHPKIQILRTKKLTVEGEELLVHVEGDVVAKTPAEIELIEAGLKVLTPID